MNTSAVSPFTLTKEQYQELYQEVLLFAKIGGVVNDEEGIWKMCHEEFVNELLPAIEAEDRIQVIDGCADSFVTSVQLHHYFMSKPSWEHGLEFGQYWSRNDNQLTALECMFERHDKEHVCYTMVRLLDVLQELAEQYNFNLYKAIKEVSRSNMTKFVRLSDLMNKYGTKNTLLRASLDCEELSNGKYKDVHATWTMNAEYALVVFRENFGNGKIVKHLSFYEEPDFTHCLLENEV